MWRPPLVLCCAVLAFAAGCGVADPAAASVGGHDIDRSEFERELRAIRGNDLLAETAGDNLLGDGERTVRATVASDWLNVVLQDLVVTLEFDRRDLSVSESDLRIGRSELDNLFRSPEAIEAFPDWFRQRVSERYARAVALRAALSDTDLSDEGLAEFYEENKGQFTRVCLSHILVPTREEAEAVVAEIAAGGDFGAVAGERSIDTGSAARGGDLGCVGLGDFVATFEEAAFSVPVGRVSEPVGTEFGFHVLLVRERSTPPLREVRDEVAAAAAGDGAAEYREFLRTTLTEADVEVDPRYGTWVSPDGQIPQVVPPAVPNPPEGRPAGPSGNPPGQPEPPPLPQTRN
ncbi:MAG: peptidylprolyl isomerase [Acidimicrobiia bacterium]